MTKKFTPSGALPSPAYFWLLNGKLTPENLKRDLRLMAQQGMRAVCPHPWPRVFRPKTMPSAMVPDYLTPAYFEAVKVIVEECRRLGMYCYLYDEGGWPSGYAAGQVRLSDPEGFAPWYINEKLECVREELPPPGDIPPADLLNKKAMEKFVELTHLPHVRAAGDSTGSVLFAAFTDEPHYPRTVYGERLSWCKDFDKIFLKRKKYDLLPFLKELFQPPAACDREELISARIDFHDVFSELFVENFFHVLRRFCRQHVLLSGGHVDADHDPRTAALCGTGHLMRSLRALDLPGIDVILHQIAPGKKPLPFAKFASSVARQGGKKWVMAEVFAVYGSGITPALQKYVIDTLIADGANLFVYSGYSMSHKKMLSHIRPHLDPVNPLWKFSHIRNSYTEQLGKWMTRGKACVPAVLYYDQRSVWAGSVTAEKAVSQMKTLSQSLFDRGSDFDFADDDALTKARSVGGKIKIGKMLYDHLILPEDPRLSPEAEANLRREKIRISTLEDVSPILPGVSQPGLRITRRLWRGKEILFFFNTALEEKTFSLPEKSYVQIYLENGGRISGPAAEKYTLAPSGSLLLVSGKAPAKTPLQKKERIVLENFRMTALDQVICTGEDFSRVSLRRPLEPVTGDWCAAAGADFSGEIAYSFDFRLAEKTSPLLLQLGDVRYAAEVWLNGRKAGEKLFPPFDFILAKNLKKGRNHLEIRVSNTLANLIVSPGTQALWQRNNVVISPYEKRQQEREQESCSSGLMTLPELFKTE